MNKLLTSVLIVAMATVALAENNVIHFKKLQSFLPSSELHGFTKSKPTGSTATAMGISSSEASVTFTKSVGDTMEIRLDVKIIDTSLMPFAAMAYTMASEFENETENGYEKSRIYKTFKSIEKVSRGDYPSCELSVMLGQRILVTVSGNNTADIHLVEQALDMVDVDKLSKVTPE